jgi:integrase
MQQINLCCISADSFIKENIDRYPWLVTQVDQIKGKYIVGYIKERLEQGLSKRTLQNDMAAIRQTLRTAGRDKLANSDQISNKALGLSGASRKGTKVAITDKQYAEIHQKALQKDPGHAAALELARTYGLRGEEAVQSWQSLQTWKAAIESGATTIKVIFGTKGGRPRDTLIIDRQRALNAVNNAIRIAEQRNGKLIDKPTLKQAMTYWRNHCSAIGLKGKISAHSLRYAFTQDAIQYYIKQGYTQKEALALTSMDLGHGDGRGRFVKAVYGAKNEQL